ncbi:lipoic acid synthetase domain protein [Anaplasma phagocytophilum str. ApWI1]|uniref:Lipoic acid synthetase domain protein n=2 Tax=Anaplasma phagocytophilum TaxID=948 RepID=A0A0F3N406_ANAPH|nr:lipoyl synthase [Anaplasma phagocytophilum str. HGE1]KJV60085.1 lipoic acid synthetase domain protein [Anaplasma phagocytophilum str. Webster]KJV62823.1 lipoic acid synthetase domain protein [Anaplasma phagocytophilum str. NCH-1]KJV82801.1 lipoic acid synthetase domain protein [Anaplasma phagocytophilum str. HGE2]KJV84934.1 lipoic acid synthetase domain protein [Anaplasma phagocytophilum str. ApWI1]KJV86913.1 lipoic acid synthetase domain protein [Anaplasma phagocytophilum str. ApNYW]KJV98
MIVGKATSKLGLKHVVITYVYGDDLPDVGYAPLSVFRKLRKRDPNVIIES